jgi:gluconolactonase
MDVMTPGEQLSDRYPDPLFQVLDKSFAKYQLPHGGVERLATGTRWGEGPVWFGEWRSVLWSDIPNDRILRWDEITGTTSVFRHPCDHANGNTRDRQGRLITCEHSGRRVTRTEYDGAITVLCDGFNGKKLNSPNDVVVKADGSTWFTDPAFGIAGWYLGRMAPAELPMSVYRIDGHTGNVTVVAEDINAPNGLAFSPDEKILYLIASRAEPREFIAFDVAGDKLTNRRTFITCGPDETPDGFRIDIDGNLWCGWGMTPELDGIRVFNSSGAPIGHITLPERCANVCFGGRYRNRLFMAAGHSLFACYVNTQGVAGG